MKNILQNPKYLVYLLLYLVLILGGFLIYQVEPKDNLLFAIGSSMIAAGITGWVVFGYVLVSEDLAEKLQVLLAYGIESVFDVRSVGIKQEYLKRLAKVREQIDIIGFGLSALRQDFLNDFSTWKQRANVRILLLDPDFPSHDHSYAEQRDIEEGNAKGQITQDVRKFVEDVGHLIEVAGEGRSFNIRLYRVLPTVNVFRIDDELFWGPYLISEQSRNTPTFIVKRSGKLFDRFINQFERIWEDEKFSRPIPKEWLEKKK
jgi:hypothetical protein